MSQIELRRVSLISLGAAALMLSGCEVVEGVFKAGVWIGVLAVVLFVAIVGAGVAFARRKLDSSR